MCRPGRSAAAVVLGVSGAYLDNARDTTLRERAALVAERVRLTPSGVRLDGAAPFPIEGGTAAYLFDAHGRLVGRVLGPRAVPPQPGVGGALTAGRGGFHTEGTVASTCRCCATAGAKCVAWYR